MHQINSFLISIKSKKYLSKINIKKIEFQALLFYGSPIVIPSEIACYYFCEKEGITRSAFENGHPDICYFSIPPKLEQVRDLLQRIDIGPRISKKMTVIIQDIDLLSTQSANALLKAIEDPPVPIQFIFSTVRYFSVIKTISSRCQHIFCPTFSDQENFIYDVDIQDNQKLNSTSLCFNDEKFISLQSFKNLTFLEKKQYLTTSIPDIDSLKKLINFWIQSYSQIDLNNPTHYDSFKKIFKFLQRLEVSVNFRLQLESVSLIL